MTKTCEYRKKSAAIGWLCCHSESPECDGLCPKDNDCCKCMKSHSICPISNVKKAKPEPCEECKKKGATIKQLQDYLHRKNVELDAMDWVWCSGGCEEGLHRYNDLPELTEEMVKAAEDNTYRLRQYYNNMIFTRKREKEQLESISKLEIESLAIIKKKVAAEKAAREAI